MRGHFLLHRRGLLRHRTTDQNRMAKGAELPLTAQAVVFPSLQSDVARLRLNGATHTRIVGIVEK